MTMRPFKATVWLGDEPGKRVELRVELEAEDVTSAGAKLRAEYGEDAVISVWNEEDRRRPRRIQL